MRQITSALRDLGLTFPPPEANFVMVVLPDAEIAARFVHDLLVQGIIIRPLAQFGLPHCVRISIGSDFDNEKCVAALHKATASAGVFAQEGT